MSAPQIMFRNARIAACKSEAELAAQMGVTFASYHDMEWFESEIEIFPSLAELHKACRFIGIDVIDLYVDVDQDIKTLEPNSFENLVRKIKLFSDANNLPIEQIENTIGWDVKHFLIDPEQGWENCLDFFRSVCEVIHENWISVLLYVKCNGAKK